ncbi:MAG TPA: hypothetical protein VF188_06475 [Longimicrobiales bacterium]
MSRRRLSYFTALGSFGAGLCFLVSGALAGGDSGAMNPAFLAVGAAFLAVALVWWVIARRETEDQA